MISSLLMLQPGSSEACCMAWPYGSRNRVLCAAWTFDSVQGSGKPQAEGTG